MAGGAAGGGRKSGAAGLHGNAGIRFCGLPQRELRGAGGEVAGRGGKDSRVDAALALSPFAEEVAQKFGGFFGGDSLLQLNLVVELGVVEDGED